MRAQKKNHNKNEFDTDSGKVRLSNHAISRLKQRVHLTSRSERKSFIKKVFSKGIHNPHNKLSKSDEFTKLQSYMYHIYRRVTKRNAYSSMIWYQDVIFIVSIEKVVITIIQIPDKFKDLFSKVKGKT